MKLNDKGKFKKYKLGDIVTYLGGMASYDKYIGRKFKITGDGYHNSSTGAYHKRGLVNNIELIDGNRTNKYQFRLSVYGECIIGTLPALPDE